MTPITKSQVNAAAGATMVGALVYKGIRNRQIRKQRKTIRRTKKIKARAIKRKELTGWKLKFKGSFKSSYSERYKEIKAATDISPIQKTQLLKNYEQYERKMGNLISRRFNKSLFFQKANFLSDELASLNNKTVTGNKFIKFTPDFVDRRNIMVSRRNKIGAIGGSSAAAAAISGAVYTGIKRQMEQTDD